MENSPGTDESNAFLLVSDDLNLIGTDLEDTHAVCVEVNKTATNSPCIKAYDSGCT